MNNEDENKLIRRLENWIDYTEAEMRYLKKSIKEIKDRRQKSQKI